MTRTLIEKLEQAKGPSRELDGAIRAKFFGDFTYCDPETACTCKDYPDCSDWDGCGVELGMSDERRSYPLNWKDDDCLPEYTSSLDAAVALVERVLGEDPWYAIERQTWHHARFWAGCCKKGDSDHTYRNREDAPTVRGLSKIPSGWGATSALALCIALLKAL